VGSRQVLVQVSVPQRTVQSAKKLAIPHQEQGGKVEYLVALDQATIIGGVYPAQSVDGQVEARQMAARPPTTGTAYAGEYQQGGSGQTEQTLISVEVAQLDFMQAASSNRARPLAQGSTHMRRFLRHPSDLPVELVLRKHNFLPRQRLHNISLGGVACNSTRGFRKGTAIELRIPLLGEQASCPGVVAWCRKQPDDYLVGICFTDEESLFRARMVEQVCQIEAYRKQREAESGETQPIEQIAEEWIAQHATEFSAASLN